MQETTEIGFYIDSIIFPEAKAPYQKYSSDAGWDIHSAMDGIITPKTSHIINTGIKLQMPLGWECQIRSRSGLAAKNQVFVLNSPGTIDCTYTGYIQVILFNNGNTDFVVKIGDRIAQMVFNKLPKIELKPINHEPNNVERGTNGFGSTGV
jgi:dUTP pyrophosphatase